MVLKYKDEDLIGKRFGKLVVVDIYRKKNKIGDAVRYAKCKCDCGNETNVFVGNLTLDKITSCGCKLVKYTDEDLIGKRFGRLIVLRVDYKLDKNNHRYKCAYCKCDCGNEKYIKIYELLRGSTESCGCLHKEQLAERNRTHDLTNHKLYNTWCSMIDRCENPNSKSYVNYGERGIAICKEWRRNAGKFINWCLENGWKDDLTIDRIDVNGNYEPSNIRFVDRHVQSVNQRVRKDNLSGYKGVRFEKKYSSWRADIKVNKISYFLGYFRSKREALEARNKFIIQNGLTEYKIQEWKGE